MPGIVQDLKFGLRGLRARPRITAVAVVSLALGLGANAAVFSLIDALLFRPFAGVQQPRGLVSLRLLSADGDSENPSMPDFLDLRAEQEVLESLAGHSRMTFSVRGDGRSERLSGELVTANYFETLGVTLSLGRDLLETEDAKEVPVVIVSARLWQRAFGGDTEALGRDLIVNGHALSVVGVAPAGFHGITVGVDHDLWVPYGMTARLWPSFDHFLRRRDQPGPAALAREKPGVSRAQAETALRGLFDQLFEAHPESDPDRRLVLGAFDGERLDRSGTTISYFALLAAVVLLVLVIAGTNVAVLRGVELQARAHELTVRTALGATKGALARLLLIENLVLYGTALVASVAVAMVLAGLLESLPLFPIPLTDLDLRIDLRVFWFAAVLAFLVSVATSLLSVVSVGRMQVTARAPLAEKLRGGRFLVGAQIALACVLVSGTALLGGVLSHAYSVDPGYRLNDILFTSVDLQSMAFRYDETRTQQFYQEVVERVEAIPGARSAAWSADIPFERMTIVTMFVPDNLQDYDTGIEEPEWLQGDADIVTPGYLTTMGIPLLRGRDFGAHDVADAPGVVLVNESFATEYWPGEDALGRRIRVWGRPGIHHETYEIVGIVKNVKYHSLFEEPGPYVYYPVAQRFFQYMNLHVHSAVPPLTLLPEVRRAFSSIDEDLPVFDARPLSEERAIALSRQRTATTLIGLSGLLALVLTALGTYSVVADQVSRRIPEIGLRVAVGASRVDIMTLVFAQTLPAVVVGLIVGASVTVWSRGWVDVLVAGASPSLVSACAIGLATMAAASAAACYLPARRAARVDPSRALRHDL